MTLTIKKGTLSALLFIAIASGSPAHAVPISVTGNGIAWTLNSDAESGVDSTGSFTLSIDVSGSTFTETAYLAEFSLKNFGSNTTLSNLVSPTGTNFDWVNEGLNANGCKTNGTDDAICVFNEDSPITNPTDDNNFLFTFDITVDDVFPDFTHLKVRWVDANGGKIGDLISKDIAWAVPAPAILGIMGIGLMGMVISSGLRHRKIF